MMLAIPNFIFLVALILLFIAMIFSNYVNKKKYNENDMFRKVEVSCINIDSYKNTNVF